MNITIEPMLAGFIGGWEIVVILMTIFVMAVVGIIVLALVIFVVNKLNKTTIAPTPTVIPPLSSSSTEVARKCPKCGTLLKGDVPEGLCPACLLQRGIATEGGAPPGTPPFTPPPMLELAKLFPQLEILEKIGQGGMGAVYKARQPALDRFVALKILAPRSGGDLDFSGRFTREARALAKLSHPNIVGVYDFGQIQRSADPGSPPSTLDPQSLSYFIMEYVDGPNLRQVEHAGKLAPREALQIIPQICAALQFAHDEGIVHRDIKPENVLLDKKGRVKIADFGLAKILGQEADFRLTGARDVMGTPHYMAPEQVEKPQEVDHRADIYSLGVVFYEMLTGELPLGKFDPPSHKVQIDVRLDDVVLRSLANNPDRRYQHVSEVKSEVETIATSASQPSAVPKNTVAGTPLFPNSFGLVFNSAAALKIARAGWALGCLGALGFLGSVSGWEMLKGFFGFAGFFGLIGLAVLIEWDYRMRQNISAAAHSAKPTVRESFLVFALALCFWIAASFLTGRAATWGDAVLQGAPLYLMSAAFAVAGFRRWQLTSAKKSNPGGTFTLLAIFGAVIIAFVAASFVIFKAAHSGRNRASLAQEASPVQEREVNKLVGDFPETPDFSTPEAAFAAWARAAARMDAEALNEMQLDPPGPKKFADWFQREQQRDTVGTTVYRQAKILSVQTWQDDLAGVITYVPHPPNAHLGAYSAVYFGRFGGEWKNLSHQIFTNEASAKNLFEDQKEMFRQLYQAAATNAAATVPAASAETWEPIVAPGEKPNLQKILDEADDLMKHGRYEEALGRQIWLQRHQIEYGGSYQNISAISSWVELGRRYPKARQALIEIRDSEAREFAKGQGFSDLFRDIVSINHELQDDDATYQLFKAIREGDPQLADQCRYYAAAVMFSKGEYQWCYDKMGAPESRLSEAKRSFDMEIGMYQRSAETQENSRKRMEEFNRQHGITNLPIPSYVDPAAMQLNFATNRFVNAVTMEIEILLGTGHATEAAQFRDRALAIMKDPRLESAITDAEARIQNRKAAPIEAPATNHQGTNAAYADLKIPPIGQWRPATTNNPDASRETWEPTLEPGAKPDLMAILQEAKELMTQQRYEDSLQRQIWYHNHSISDPSQLGVRNSFALADWIELGRRYPKAMQALIEIRDENTRKISSGEGYFDLFLETASINRELGNDERTRALFKQLAASPDKNLAQQCYSAAESVLVSHGDYGLCMNFIGEPEKRFKKLQDQWQRLKESEQHQADMLRQMDDRIRATHKQSESNGIAAASWSPPVMPQPPKTADKRFVGQTRQLIEILVGAGHKSDAEKIRDEAIALLDDPGLKSAVDDAEKTIHDPKPATPQNRVPSLGLVTMPPPAALPPPIQAPQPGGVIRPVRSLPMQSPRLTN